MKIMHYKKNMINSINSFIKNLNIFKKNINKFDEKNMKKILVNSKKVRKQIIELKQDVSKPDLGKVLFFTAIPVSGRSEVNGKVLKKQRFPQASQFQVDLKSGMKNEGILKKMRS